MLLWTEEAGFPQLQFLEFWQLDKPTAAHDRIFDGVQIDTQDRVLGCWLDGDLQMHHWHYRHCHRDMESGAELVQQ